jgi:hypothetical protein
MLAPGLGIWGTYEVVKDFCNNDPVPGCRPFRIIDRVSMAYSILFCALFFFNLAIAFFFVVRAVPSIRYMRRPRVSCSSARVRLSPPMRGPRQHACRARHAQTRSGAGAAGRQIRTVSVRVSQE